MSVCLCCANVVVVLTRVEVGGGGFYCKAGFHTNSCEVKKVRSVP